MSTDNQSTPNIATSYDDGVAKGVAMATTVGQEAANLVGMAVGAASTAMGAVQGALKGNNNQQIIAKFWDAVTSIQNQTKILPQAKNIINHPLLGSIQNSLKDLYESINDIAKRVQEISTKAIDDTCTESVQKVKNLIDFVTEQLNDISTQLYAAFQNASQKHALPNVIDAAAKRVENLKKVIMDFVAQSPKMIQLEDIQKSKDI